jgi:dipeptidyl aminopeptidase/acylaminoacyl peptidase
VVKQQSHIKQTRMHACIYICMYTYRCYVIGDAVELYMKCKPDSEENIQKYKEASPIHRLPTNDVPMILVTGQGDKDVPMDMVIEFSDAVVQSGGSTQVILCDDQDDHYVPVDSSSAVWSKIQAAIDAAVL